MSFGNFLVVFILILQTTCERRQICKVPVNNGQLHYSKIIIKLCLLFRTAELIVLVQILNAELKGQSDVILHAIFGLLHIFL